MTTKTDPWQDQARRFGPSQAARTAALAALEAREAAEVAVVPLYMPGKSYLSWTVGQRVESVERVGEDVLLGVEAPRADAAAPTDSMPAVRDLTERAFELARDALAEHGAGTTGYAIVRRDGKCSVFEDIRSAL